MLGGRLGPRASAECSAAARHRPCNCTTALVGQHSCWSGVHWWTQGFFRGMLQGIVSVQVDVGRETASADGVLVRVLVVQLRSLYHDHRALRRRRPAASFTAVRWGLPNI